MFGRYIPSGLEPPAYRIVPRIWIVLSTYVEVEPPIQRAASKVTLTFSTHINLIKL